MKHDLIPAGFLDEIPRKISYSTALSGRTNKFERQMMGANEFIAHVTNHRAGPKEGSAWSPFDFADDTRLGAGCNGTAVIVLDSDFGVPAERIALQLSLHEFAAAIVSTHSHLMNEKAIDAGIYTAWERSNAGKTPADFLRQRGYCEQVAKSARRLPDAARHQGPNGGKTNERIVIRHAPCPKYRVILFLSEYWRVSDCENAAREWKRAIRKIAKTLRLTIDESCADLARYYFDPRHPAGVEPVIRIVRGRTIDSNWLFDENGDDGAKKDGNPREFSGMNILAKKKVFRDNLDVLESAVMTIKNDERFNNRNEWIKILGGIHFETDGSAEGLALARKWSVTWTGGASDSDETERVWNTLRRKC